MKTCPHCFKEINDKGRKNKRSKAKKWTLGYRVSKCKPASNDKSSWVGSGWGIPESLNTGNWEDNPSFARDAFYQQKGFDPEYYSVERKNQ